MEMDHEIDTTRCSPELLLRIIPNVLTTQHFEWKYLAITDSRTAASAA